MPSGRHRRHHPPGPAAVARCGTCPGGLNHAPCRRTRSGHPPPAGDHPERRPARNGPHASHRHRPAVPPHRIDPRSGPTTHICGWLVSSSPYPTVNCRPRAAVGRFDACGHRRGCPADPLAGRSARPPSPRRTGALHGPACRRLTLVAWPIPTDRHHLDGGLRLDHRLERQQAPSLNPPPARPAPDRALRPRPAVGTLPPARDQTLTPTARIANLRFTQADVPPTGIVNLTPRRYGVSRYDMQSADAIPAYPMDAEPERQGRPAWARNTAIHVLPAPCDCPTSPSARSCPS